MSHMFAFDVPDHTRPFFITDAAINIYPVLEDKRDIAQKLHRLCACTGQAPKGAILSAVETVTSKIRSTVEAAALCKVRDRGQITGGILDGPLAFDNAAYETAAQAKAIDSPRRGWDACGSSPCDDAPLAERPAMDRFPRP